jgi:hypothetical protein
VSEDIDKFKLEMLKRFRMSDLRLLTYYLGIEVRQDEAEISLCQSAYALKLLEREDRHIGLQFMPHSIGGSTSID